MHDFTILKKTGLKQSGELDRIFNVSRITINKYWHHDGVKPLFVRDSRRKRVERALKLLTILVERGTLPLDKGVSDEERHTFVDKIIVKVAEQKSPD